MSSRIFQLSEEPINEEDYISEEMFYDNFVGTVADYVDGDTDRDEDIEWLLSVLEPYGVKFDKKEKSIIFLEGFKIRYFEKRFQETKEFLQQMTLEQFATDTLAVYQLQELIEDEFGFYIYIDYYMPLDNFIRELEENKKYYIGGTVGYH